jgi:D-alanine--poly(phosphoribitol) ligase subunit 2
MNDAIIERLGALFVESLHIDAPTPDTDLFESGTLDSLQLVELLLQIERRFGVQIAVENIDLDDLRTLGRIARLVASQQSSSASKNTTNQEQAEPQPKVTELRAWRARGLR